MHLLHRTITWRRLAEDAAPLKAGNLPCLAARKRSLRYCEKGLFQKSPLKSRAVHGATICDVIFPINTQYGAKSRHSRENGNLEALAPIGFEFMKHPRTGRLTRRTRATNERTGIATAWRHRVFTQLGLFIVL